MFKNNFGFISCYLDKSCHVLKENDYIFLFSSSASPSLSPPPITSSVDVNMFVKVNLLHLSLPLHFSQPSLDHFTNTTLMMFLILPAALLVGVQTSDELDELLGDELLGHDQLQLVKVSPLFL